MAKKKTKKNGKNRKTENKNIKQQVFIEAEEEREPECLMQTESEIQTGFVLQTEPQLYVMPEIVMATETKTVAKRRTEADYRVNAAADKVKAHFRALQSNLKKTFGKGLSAASEATKVLAAGFGEFRSACLKNRKCALSAAMAGLSLVIGLTALLSLGSPALATAAIEQQSRAVVTAAEPISAYPNLEVTGVPVEVGLSQPSPFTLLTKPNTEPEYKVGDSCEVVYSRSIYSMNEALQVKNPFNVFQTIYNLRVDGEIVASFKTPSEGRQVMDKIVAMNTGEKSEIVKLEYKESVEVTKDEASFLDDNTFSKVDDAVNFLMTGTKEMKKYSIVAGDIPETIAESHGMTIDELEAANPSIVGRGHLLQIGEELNLVIPKPLVNVMTTERKSYVKNVDFEIVEKENPEMYEGDVVVQEEGEYGRSEVVAEVVRENGREVSRTVLSEKVLKEPKKEIVTVGTKPAPPRKGSGYLDYPLQRGFEVSSPFGMRWGFLHSGIDLACPQGTPIVAADGGVVTFAGWDSLGGLMVKIDHGGNISTGYAHCDYLAVSEGDQVFKGQYIADVGMTGFTTGPHLHFEVLYDGVHTDPSEYLAFY